MATVSQVTTPGQLDDVRGLMRAFVGWHRERHVEDITLIDRYFNEGEFEQELAGLPGKYAQPQGSLLLASHQEKPAGCVALRDLGSGVCEMKRMYVPAEFRGLGIGRALVERVVEDAKMAGYWLMRLDTSKRQSEAMQLYERSGFRRTAPYYPMSDELKEWLVFFEMEL